MKIILNIHNQEENAQKKLNQGSTSHKSEDNPKKTTNTGKDKGKGALKLCWWWECTSSTGHFGNQYPGFTKLKAELI